jgi:hypothetical protein
MNSPRFRLAALHAHQHLLRARLGHRDLAQLDHGVVARIA